LKKNTKDGIVRNFKKITPKTKQLAKILSGGRSSQIMDLTYKLRERPTPKFSEAVASCGQ